MSEWREYLRGRIAGWYLIRSGHGWMLYDPDGVMIGWYKLKGKAIDRAEALAHAQKEGRHEREQVGE